MTFKYQLHIERKDGTVFTDPDFALVFREVIEKPDSIKHFSAVGEKKYTIDLSQLPENARPIHYVVRSQTHDAGGEMIGETATHYFGYQYTTPDGNNVKAIRELP